MFIYLVGVIRFAIYYAVMPSFNALTVNLLMSVIRLDDLESNNIALTFKIGKCKSFYRSFLVMMVFVMLMEMSCLA